MIDKYLRHIFLSHDILSTKTNQMTSFADHLKISIIFNKNIKDLHHLHQTGKKIVLIWVFQRIVAVYFKTSNIL